MKPELFLLRVFLDALTLLSMFAGFVRVRRWRIERQSQKADRLTARETVNVFGDQVFPDPQDDRWRIDIDIGGYFARIEELRVYEHAVSMNGITIVKGSRRTARFLKAIQDHRTAMRVGAARAAAEKLLEGP